MNESDAEGMYALLKRRDAELVALRVYVNALENELREAIGEDHRQQGWESADKQIASLREEHGFKSDGRFRG
jgi:hypothetical protein